MSEVRRRVLQRLGDGAVHRGAAIAAELGVSRAAVAKQVGRLRELGWDIVTTTEGYRLQAGQRPLEPGALERSLAGLRGHIARFDLLETVDSTSSHLARLAPVDDGRVQLCIAEHQQAGRGRRGRSWHGRPGGSIALSVAATLPLAPPALAGLSIAAGVVCAETLVALGVDGVRLKWPNDLLVGEAKIGGMLVEISGEAAGPSRVILGIGVNHDLGDERPDAGRAVTDIARSAPEWVAGRSAVTGALAAAAVELLEDFRRTGLGPYLPRWRRFDDLAGREVEVDSRGAPVRGTALGVADDGALRVRTASGERAFHSGEVSVRPAS